MPINLRCKHDRSLREGVSDLFEARWGARPSPE